MSGRFWNGDPDQCHFSSAHSLLNCVLTKREGATQDTGISPGTTCKNPSPRMPPGPEGGLQEVPVGRTESTATVWYKPLKQRLPPGFVLQRHSLLLVPKPDSI